MIYRKKYKVFYINEISAESVPIQECLVRMIMTLYAPDVWLNQLLYINASLIVSTRNYLENTHKKSGQCSLFLCKTLLLPCLFSRRRRNYEEKN